MVERRKKIGLLFSYSEGWIGGSYYFINLVSALMQLKDDIRPQIIVVSESEKALDIMKETGYPYLGYFSSKFHYSILERLVNKLGKLIIKKQLIQKTFPKGTIDVLFGYYEQLFAFAGFRKIYWIPDLQDKYYPEYLGVNIAEKRKSQHEKLAYSDSEILFSSNDSENDFEKFYSGSTCKKYVVPFAVTLPVYEDITFKEVASKYNISQLYFFSPNQFWSHKNHLTVIKAVEILKQEGIDINVVFTGNETTGGGAYAKELKEYVRNSGLEGHCLFLGFIDRKEQLVLMKNSIAVIQPFLFEGWSTVVEDAKCMGKYLVLSDLKVHREQIDINVIFFSPSDATELASVIKKLVSDKFEVIDKSYKQNLIAFANGFLHAVNGYRF